jgi:murein DD-endopeptidase MepM/ murein hydrolase activator NlpD
LNKSSVSIVVTLSLLGTLLTSQAGFAATDKQKQLEQQLKDVQRQKAEAEKNAANAKAQAEKLEQQEQQNMAELNTIMSQIDAVNLELNKLKEKETVIQAAKTENEKQLAEAEERMASRDQILRSRVRLMYMSGTVSYAEVLLSSTSFTDFLDRMNALKAIVNQDKEILDANKRDRDLKAEKQEQIALQAAELNQLIAERNATKASLTVKEKEKEVKIASLSKQKREFAEISEDEVKAQVKLASQESVILRRIAEEKAANTAKAKGEAPKPVFSYSGGKFGYPLERVVNMSSDFGGRKDPITGKGASHSGIDLPSPAGTDILAAEAGVVIVASWWSGYGNTVIIDHGKGVWTLYGHIRNDGIVVEKGDVVKRGQKIAEVGSTGRSTGNHLHFEVRINEEPVDPKPYLR